MEQRLVRPGFLRGSVGRADQARGRQCALQGLRQGLQCGVLKAVTPLRRHVQAQTTAGSARDSPHLTSNTSSLERGWRDSQVPGGSRNHPAARGHAGHHPHRTPRPVPRDLGARARSPVIKGEHLKPTPSPYQPDDLGQALKSPSSQHGVGVGVGNDAATPRG
ncbi:hypothetical protein VULLAG_LOCUS10289 [Vulpes lagopus]